MKRIKAVHTSANQGNVLVGWALAIIRAMQSHGVSLETLVVELNLDICVLRNGAQRLDQEYVDRLWSYAAEHIKDPAFGLTVAKHVRPASFHVVGHAMSCSANLYRSLSRFSQFCRLISQSATATLVHGDQWVALEFYFDPEKKPPTHHSYDVVLAMVLNFAREISGRPITPTKVYFSSQTKTLAEPYQQFFSCPIHYVAGHSSIVFSKADLDEDILGADERLAALLDELAKKDLALRMEGRFSTRITDSLLKQFAEGACSKERTAKMLNMTSRTLLRRLKSEGVTYNGIVNQFREELAMKYIAVVDMPFKEVALRLGFSDYTTFARAFSRWTGSNPSEMRRKICPLDGHENKLSIT
ncbi:MAG: AraC-like DNA-binding protein [Zhongshania sp.]|jgi:AraC-like DNA-binding protein|nr:AraC family transcriptional regulator ligand-binding domain-containing protein [Zhongshania sp.]